MAKFPEASARLFHNVFVCKGVRVKEKQILERFQIRKFHVGNVVVLHSDQLKVKNKRGW